MWKTTPFVDHVRVLGDHPQVVTANPQWHEGDHPQLGKKPSTNPDNPQFHGWNMRFASMIIATKPPFLGHFLAIFDARRIIIHGSLKSGDDKGNAGDRIRPRIRSESWFSPCMYVCMYVCM